MSKQLLSPRAGGVAGVLCAAVLTVALGCCAALPAVAGAEATPAPPNRYSSQSGLPDGRVYEQVSPANKNGYQAGVNNNDEAWYAAAAPEGNAVLFKGLGPMGEGSVSGLDQVFVARRTAGGWVTHTPAPRPEVFNQESVKAFQPSQDLSRLLFTSENLFAPESPEFPLEGGMYLARADGSTAWLTEPSPGFTPDPASGSLEPGSTLHIAGGAADLSTVFFTYDGTLVSQDATREPVIKARGGFFKGNVFGFYEWSETAGLVNAGALPEGSRYPGVPDPYGAQPAGNGPQQAFSPAETNNQVSADGDTAFFTSPDPGICPSPLPNKCGELPQLYAREDAAGASPKTVLVSQSQLPGHVGEPAPDGPELLSGAPETDQTVVDASADGSQAFFQSPDALTTQAEAAHDGTARKTYDFDTVTGTLTYLPGVAGTLRGVAANGAWLLFENTSSAPFELELWSAGPNGGSVVPVAQLPAPPANEENNNGTFLTIGPVRASADQSVIVFETDSPLPGGFNDGGGYRQIFRYEVPAGRLACVSCPPAGTIPAGGALLSHPDQTEYPDNTVDTRNVSEDGSRVFFETPSPLVPQDVDGVADVYEWEDGTVYLISPGTGTKSSWYLDNSASGDDVFFATATGLAPGDTDGGYDVYDARVPRPGDEVPPAPVPCQGSVCQGPPAIPQLLGAPASGTFAGLGNPPAASETPPPAVVKPTAKAKRCKKGFVKKKGKCIRAKGKKKAKKASHDRRAK